MTVVPDLVEGASDAAFAINDAHQVVAWNHAAQQLLGYAPREVIGRRCAAVLQAVLPSGEPLCVPECEVFRCFQRCLPTGVASCRVRHKDGEWVRVSIASVVMPRRAQRWHPGSVVAVVFLREMEERHVQPPSPQTLQIFTLGCFGLTVGGRGLAIEKWKRKQSLTLLKYLVIHVGRPVHRERLLDCLWPDIDESRGRGRLKVAMYYLRCQLRATGMDEDVVQTAGDTYKLRRETVWVDVEVFEKLFAEGCALQRQQQWGEALRCYQEVQPLYRGDYLEEETFADWCAEERERLREIYLELLAGMAECNAERGHYAEAVRVCRMALIREPCRESFHCALMEYFVRLGRPDWAVAQFRHCRRVLDREFGVEPMPETQHLHQQILKGEGGALAKENARGSRRARRPLRGAGAQPSA